VGYRTPVLESIRGASSICARQKEWAGVSTRGNCVVARFVFRAGLELSLIGAVLSCYVALVRVGQTQKSPPDSEGSAMRYACAIPV